MTNISCCQVPRSVISRIKETSGSIMSIILLYSRLPGNICTCRRCLTTIGDAREGGNEGEIFHPSDNSFRGFGSVPLLHSLSCQSYKMAPCLKAALYSVVPSQLKGHVKEGTGDNSPTADILGNGLNDCSNCNWRHTTEPL